MLIKEFFRKLIGLILALSLQVGAVGGVNNALPAKNSDPVSNSSCLEIIPPKSPAVTFHVPETIYLKPAEGANAHEFQFFIDYNNDGSLRTPQPNETDTINATQNTSGKLYFYAPNASVTNVNITVDKASFTPESLTRTANEYKCTIPSTGKLTTNLSPGQTEVLTWTATYYIDGIAKTAKAYTVCYAPLVEPIAAGYKLTWQDNEAVAWISGATALDTSGGNRSANLTNLSPLFGNIKASGNTSDYLTGSSGSSRYGEKTGMTGYNWVTVDSPKGSLVVDTSRYADLNQLPNLSVGFVYAKCGGNSESDWKVGNYNGLTAHTGNDKGDTNNATQKAKKTVGVELASGTGNGTGVKYNKPIWSQNVSSTDEMRFRAYSLSYAGTMYRSVGAATCYLTVNRVDKSALRSIVKEHINMAEQASSYAHEPVKFAAYQKAIKDAAELLGDPSKSVTENNIVDKFTSLSKQTFSVYINHRFNNGRPMETQQATFDAGSTVVFGLCEHAGYTPKSALGYTTSLNTQTVANCHEEIIQYYDYNAHTYTVLYNGNENTGGITLQTKHTYDVERNLANNGFNRDGHSFVEWNTEADGTGTGYASGVAVKNLSAVDGEIITLYAIWNAGDHNIIFNGNGGVGTMPNQVVEYGSSVILNENVYARQNYTFVGWNTQQDGSGDFYANEALFGPMGDEDVTLYAQWAIKKYLVTFDANGGEGGYSELMEYGKPLSAPEVTREGYEFVEWEPSVPNTVPAHDATYVARWKVMSFKITFDANGGEGGTSGLMEYGESLTPPEVTKEGHTFLGWSPEPPDTVPAHDATYTAVWEEMVFVITFDANGGEGGYSEPMEYGKPLSAPEVTREGYEFVEWEPSVPNTVPAHDATYVARWKVMSFKITFDANGGEGGTSGLMEYGESLTPPEVTKEGHTFLGWSPEPPDTVPAYDAIYIAQWEVMNFDVSFDANGGYFTEFFGLDVIKKSLPYGSDLVAPGVARDGYVFDGWKPILPENVPAHASYFEAQWLRAQTEVSFNLNGETAGTVPDTQIGEIGSAVDLPEQGDIEKLGYEFLGWALADDATEALESFNFQESDTTLYAVWKKIPVELYAKPGSGLVLDKSVGSYIFGVLPGTSKEDFILNLAGINGNGELRFSENEGRFGTGLKVELIDLEDNSVVDSYHIVILGDVDGDGLVTQADADIVRNTAAFVGDIKGGVPYRLAADLNGDGIIDAFDYNLFKAALKGVFAI